jgi:hypothetical protein
MLKNGSIRIVSKRKSGIEPVDGELVVDGQGALF